jgi:hypothetical protein
LVPTRLQYPTGYPYCAVTRFGRRALLHFHANEKGSDERSHLFTGYLFLRRERLREAEPPAKEGRLKSPARASERRWARRSFKSERPVLEGRPRNPRQWSARIGL